MIAKKIGHKCYAAKRRLGFINSVKNEVYGIDENYTQYNVRVRKLLENNDNKSFIKLALLQPSVVLSTVVDSDFYKKDYFRIAQFQNRQYGKEMRQKPLLLGLGMKFQDVKLFELFLNCMFHYSWNILGEEKEEKPFLMKYFNFNDCNNGIIANQYFVKYFIVVVVVFGYHKFDFVLFCVLFLDCCFVCMCF